MCPSHYGSSRLFPTKQYCVLDLQPNNKHACGAPFYRPSETLGTRTQHQRNQQFQQVVPNHSMMANRFLTDHDRWTTKTHTFCELNAFLLAVFPGRTNWIQSSLKRILVKPFSLWVFYFVSMPSRPLATNRLRSARSTARLKQAAAEAHNKSHTKYHSNIMSDLWLLREPFRVLFFFGWPSLNKSHLLGIVLGSQRIYSYRSRQRLVGYVLHDLDENGMRAVKFNKLVRIQIAHFNEQSNLCESFASLLADWRSCNQLWIILDPDRRSVIHFFCHSFFSLVIFRSNPKVAIVLCDRVLYVWVCGGGLMRIRSNRALWE